MSAKKKSAQKNVQSTSTSMPSSVDISVVVVSYNTKDLTKKALNAIQQSFKFTPELTYELIIVDNNSEDGSKKMLSQYSSKSKKGNIITILNDANIGFGAANNIGIKKAKGSYILLLNSDLIADNVDFSDLITYMETHTRVAGLTVRVELPNGQIDPASHRGFPTLWRSFCYFSKLQALTRHIPFLNRVFGGYHLVHKDLDSTHEIDAPTAAFWLCDGNILKELDGFDEAYFMYGEDLDLAYRMNKAGYINMYHPIYTVLHLKYQSGLKNKKKKTQSKTTYHFYNAMKTFYDKHYAQKHTWFVNELVYKAIDVKHWLSTI